MIEIEPGFYQHYKGKIYYVLGIFINAETNEKMVCYTNFKENWTRPLGIFIEILEGKSRFQKIPAPPSQFLNLPSPNESEFYQLKNKVGIVSEF